MDYEDQQFTNIEKMNNKHQSTVNQQVSALRKAFNTLADVVLEELEQLKGEFNWELDENNQNFQKRLEYIQEQLNQQENEKQSQKLIQQQSDSEVLDKLNSMEKKQEELIFFVQEQLKQSKDDSRMLFEKMKVIINNNSSQLELLGKENEKFKMQQTDAKYEIEQLQNSRQDHQQMLIDLQEKLKIQSQDFNNKVNELKNQMNFVKENIKLDTQNILRTQNELNKRILEQNQQINERVDMFNNQNKQKSSEIENSLNVLLHDIQINVLENLIHSFKVETGQIMTEQDTIFTKKNEQFTHALFEICRQLKIPNPLINY